MEQTEDDENYFMDPYDNYSSKTIATVAYILGLPCCFVAAVFIWFEASGRAGPYRTCINQLVSRIYFLLILYCGVIELLDLIRAWYGPMPDTYCEVLQVLRHCIHLMVFLLWMVVALLKFWIVCVRKTVPTMDDNFVTTFITMASFMLALLFSLAGVMLPQKPALAHWICNGRYGPLEHGGKRLFPVSSIIAGLSLICNLISAISVYIQRRKMEKSDLSVLGLNPLLQNRIPKSLESLLGNCFVILWVFSHGVSTFLFKTPIDGMDQLPYAYLPLEQLFVCPFILIFSIALVIICRHGKAIKPYISIYD